MNFDVILTAALKLACHVPCFEYMQSGRVDSHEDTFASFSCIVTVLAHACCSDKAVDYLAHADPACGGRLSA